MKKILSIFLLILLVNCTTTSTNNTPKSPIDNVIDVFKSIPFPTM